ncbi:nucleotidyl transferase AbiEii/AbiGii toxin family protein [Sphaerotilaceae bacterium SBD11-9]
MTANRAASIRARLKQHTDTSKQDFNLTLTQYGLERLLYRLSISEHAPNFLLKGALLFQLWYGPAHRPTRDADLLGFGPDDVPTLVGVFRSICGIAVDDGIVFDPGSVAGTEIRKDAGYGGVRIDLRATLDGARLALQIDIGFGDAVTPAAQPVTYPTLLPDVPAPTLRAYPKATVVAEKLHAVTVLGMTNTRMKDFFDLWVLLHDTTLDDSELRRAVEATFARRQTDMPSALPIGLSDAFADGTTKQLQWRAFLNKNKLEPMDLREVIKTIRQRAQHVGIPRT